MKSDIQIAQEATMLPIKEVAASIGIEEDDLELYGKYKAKISDELIEKSKNNPDGKLILVTAINPTPAGEGKTTTSVGLGQAFGKLGKKALIALREPSLGPCFGIKGGAAGGGYAQVVPMEDLNLHFTGDFHAITSANNLLAALLDNHIQQGNELGIDPRQIVWKRCLDMNDRVLRNVVVGLGSKMDGMVREDHFVITVASEIMAILCLADDMNDLKRRLGRIIVAYTFDGKPVTAEDLQAVGSMAALLKDALKPNLIQTLEHTPAIVHGGPFANIAHGCNSVRATKTALKLADYVITEAGFGADLGAEKFFDIKCRKAGLHPDAVVLVATIRALKYNGGVPKDQLSEENLDALKKGIVNLEKHIENLQKYGVPVVVTLNSFITDTKAETDFVEQFCKERGCEFALSEVWEKGGEGGIALANKVLETLETKESNFKLLYDDDLSLKEKIETVAREIYGADGVTYSAAAEKELKRITDLGMDKFPVCMAKTQYSLSDDAKKLGRPSGFTINVREVFVSAGAGFVVAINGSIMTMPGLPKKPAAYQIDVDDNGVITGLFYGDIMANIIDGKQISKDIKEELKAEVASLAAQGRKCCLAVIQVGNDPASSVYVGNKKKACAYVGIESLAYELPEETTEEELLTIIDKLNKDANVHGILCQLPLPKHINEDHVIKAISPKKDVDGFHPQNVGALVIGEKGFVSCTPAGIIQLLKRSNIEMDGKHCVVVGRSNIVGKPMSLLMLRENATVTICHSHTKNLKEICKEADILIVAIGKPQFIDKEYVKDGAVVIDVGIHRDENNKLCGDVKYDEVEPIASYITPVPGGVGPMTIAMLMHNCVEAMKLYS